MARRFAPVETGEGDKEKARAWLADIGRSKPAGETI